MRPALRVLLLLILVLVGGGAAVAVWARAEMRASLPQLDGEHVLGGLSGSVTVEHDALGTPTIRGASRDDVARATGFVHAQDRFFQMDLARRRAAGELAALVGARALTADREIRLHRFRDEARRAVDLMRAEDRRLLEAYTSGVNAGLTSLGATPGTRPVLRPAGAGRANGGIMTNR